jgi:hypothetical protein
LRYIRIRCFGAFDGGAAKAAKEFPHVGLVFCT